MGVGGKLARWESADWRVNLNSILMQIKVWNNIEINLNDREKGFANRCTFAPQRVSFYYR